MESKINEIIDTVYSILKKEYITGEDNHSLVVAYNRWFHYSRYYNKSWENLFSEKLKSKFEKNDHYDLLKNIFTSKIQLKQNHLYYIEQIMTTGVMPSLYINMDSKYKPIFFLMLYKDHLLTKHLISFMFHFTRADDKKYKSIEELIKRVTKKSISGKIFYSENDSYFFTIPSNRAACFIFNINNRNVSVDVSLSQEYDEMIALPHFFISHISSVKDIQETKNNLINYCKKDHSELFDRFYNEEQFEISKLTEVVTKKTDYIFCHENDYNYASFNKDQLSIFKIIGIENPKLFNREIPNEVYKLFSNHMLYSTSKIKQHTHSRDYYISYLINYVINKDIEDLISMFSRSDRQFILKGISYRLSYPYNYLDHNSKVYFEYFHRACENSSIEREEDIFNIYSTLSEEEKFNNLPEFIKSNKQILKLRAVTCHSRILEILEDNYGTKDYKSVYKKIIKINSKFSQRKVKEMLNAI